jgi:hypothetical protein
LYFFLTKDIPSLDFASVPTGIVNSTCCGDELTSVNIRLTIPGVSKLIVCVMVPEFVDVLSVTIPSCTTLKLNDASLMLFWVIPSRTSKLKR